MCHIFHLLVSEKFSLWSLVCSFVKFVSLCRFQVHEDTDASFDDLSDCSSDSMEVCCDELGESPKINLLLIFSSSINAHA